MRGSLRHGLLIGLAVAASTAGGSGAMAASWSKPVAMAPEAPAAQPARTVWTAGGGVVALVEDLNFKVFAYGSAGHGPFARLGPAFPGFSENFVVAALPGGGAVAAYDTDQGVFASFANPGAGFGPPLQLAGLGNGVPQVAVSGSGDVFVLWQTVECESGCPSDPTQIRVAVSRGLSGQFEPTQTVSAPSLWASRPQIVVDRNGDALVTWLSNVAPPGGVDETTLAYSTGPAGAAFGPPRAATTQTGLLGFRLAASPAGDAVLAWDSAFDPVQAATGTVAQGFGAAKTLGAGTSGSARAAIGRGGGIVAWTEGKNSRRIRVAPLATGRLGAARTVARGPIRSLEVAVDGRGRRVVAWREQTHHLIALHAALSNAAGRFAAQRLDGARKLFFSLGATPGGDAILTWIVRNAGKLQIRAASAPPGHRFGKRVRVSRRSPTAPPGLAVGPSRKALVYWPERNGDQSEGFTSAAYYRP